MTTELITAPFRARLLTDRDEAVAMITSQMRKGMALKDVRIRSQQELEKARQMKSEWTQYTGAMLAQMFDSEEVFDEFNRWVGRILPEFSDLSCFVELYCEEIDYRLATLNGIYQWLHAAGELVNNEEQPAPQAKLAEPAQTSPAAVAQPAPPQTPVSPAPAPQAPRAVPSAMPPLRPPSAQAKRSGALIVHARNQAIQDSVSKFISMLGYELISICDEGSPSAAVIDKLTKHPGVVFAIVLAGDDEIAAASASPPDSAPQPSRRSAFELGFCAGRLGAHRTCVLHTAAAGLFRDAYDILYIPVDPAEGWQLQLARQLKQAGIEVDLNRLC